MLLLSDNQKKTQDRDTMPPLPLIEMPETYTCSTGGGYVIPATKVGDAVVGSESENDPLQRLFLSFFSMTAPMAVTRISSLRSRRGIVNSRSPRRLKRSGGGRRRLMTTTFRRPSRE